jgi:hypothetical protein
MAIEIVDLPSKNGGFFHSFLYVYQRVVLKFHADLEIPHDLRKPQEVESLVKKTSVHKKAFYFGLPCKMFYILSPSNFQGTSRMCLKIWSPRFFMIQHLNFHMINYIRLQ